MLRNFSYILYIFYYSCVRGRGALKKENRRRARVEKSHSRPADDRRGRGREHSSYECECVWGNATTKHVCTRENWDLVQIPPHQFPRGNEIMMVIITVEQLRKYEPPCRFVKSGLCEHFAVFLIARARKTIAQFFLFMLYTISEKFRNKVGLYSFFNTTTMFY